MKILSDRREFELFLKIRTPLDATLPLLVLIVDE